MKLCTNRGTVPEVKAPMIFGYTTKFLTGQKGSTGKLAAGHIRVWGNNERSAVEMPAPSSTYSTINLTVMDVISSRSLLPLVIPNLSLAYRLGQECNDNLNWGCYSKSKAIPPNNDADLAHIINHVHVL
ncbi:hypothetical protein J6590_018963 [Homalodisca vitripennis]|nr:hypothetical protein J6590_018963 [Homalodisca vitripennis]